MTTDRFEKSPLYERIVKAGLGMDVGAPASDRERELYREMIDPLVRHMWEIGVAQGLWPSTADKPW